MLDLPKISSKIRKNFVSNPQLNMIYDVDCDVTMDLQQKSFIEPAESCTY